MPPSDFGRDQMTVQNRRLSAILVSDVVGYTSLMERAETDTWLQVKSLRTMLLEPSIVELMPHTVVCMRTSGVIGAQKKNGPHRVARRLRWVDGGAQREIIRRCPGRSSAVQPSTAGSRAFGDQARAGTLTSRQSSRRALKPKANSTPYASRSLKTSEEYLLSRLTEPIRG